jgi:hypothetical protein
MKRLFALLLALCLLFSCTSNTPSESPGNTEEPPPAERPVEPPPPAGPAETPNFEDWEGVSAIVGQYIGEWHDTRYNGLINDRIPLTALLGNGDIGVASGGDGRVKSFHISKSDFWVYGGAPIPIGGVTIRSAAPEKTGRPVSLAQGKTVDVSSFHPNFAPERAVSGQWNAGYEGWVSDVGNPQWLVVDFGEPVPFDRVIIRHDAAARPGETANVTRAFTLETSGDGTDWTERAAAPDNADAVSDCAFPEVVTARYLRLNITQGTQETTDDSRSNPRARIGQLEVYNTADHGEEIPGEYAADSITDFYEKQDILNAEIYTEFKWDGNPVEMRTYTAAGSNILVTELTSRAAESLDLRALTWGKADNPQHPVTASSAAATATVTRATMAGVPNSGDRYAYKSVAALSTRIVGVSPSDSGGGGSSAWLDFTLPAGETVYIVTAVGGGGRTYDHQNRLTGLLPEDQAAGLLETADSVGKLEELRAAHAAWWQAFWLRSYIKLDAGNLELEVIQKYYYAAQYQLGTNCSTDGVAPGLYGLWHTTDTPLWRSDFHLNYNYIATFYGIFSSNRPEYAQSAVQMILDYAPHAEAAAGNTSELRKVRPDFVDMKVARGEIDPVNGIPDALLFPVGIGPFGMKLDPAYHNQTLNGAFSATLLIDWYDATHDEAYLRNTLYPFLVKIANFYEVWLEKEDGKYVLYAGYNEGSWATNSAAELAALKNVLARLIEFSEALGADADKRVLWAEILGGLAPQPVSDWEGTLVYALAETVLLNGEWISMPYPVPGDGNIITLESVKPTNIIGYYSAPEELKLAQDTIDVYSNRGAWNQQNNFPKIYPIAVNVRYPAERIVHYFARTIQSQMRANLFIHDNTHGLEKAGAVAAVNDMLLLTDKGVLTLFPNWLKDHNAEFKRLRSGTFTVSAAYDGATNTIKEGVKIRSEAGAVLTLASPWANPVVVDQDGNTVATTAGTAPNHPDIATVSFQTERGMIYEIRRG